MTTPRVLFVHIPQKRKDVFAITMIPVGTFALADLLHRNGYHTQIVHTLVEHIIDSEFSLADYVSHGHYDVVCMPLHWHYQTYDVLTAAEELKTQFPHLTIVLGGYTASAFFEDIMASCPCVDFLIRGEAEVPLLQLIKHIANGSTSSFAAVPNLVWRDPAGSIVTNDLEYVAGQDDIDALNYANLSLLRRHEVYVRLPEFAYSPNDRYALLDEPRFLVATGRGCPVQCFNCGGGRDAQRTIAGRTRHCFRSREAVLGEVGILLQGGIRHLAFDFDPEPDGHYYTDLFGRIPKTAAPLKCTFASWRLPPPELIDVFYEGPFSCVELVLSPDFGSDAIRRANKGMFFSNDELFATLQSIERRIRDARPSIRVSLYFFLGAPNEDAVALEETHGFIKTILDRFACVRNVIAQVPQIEPASPLLRSDEDIPWKSQRVTFNDFHDYSKKLHFEGPDLQRAELMGFVRSDSDNRQLEEWENRIRRLIAEPRSIFETPSSPPVALHDVQQKIGRNPGFSLRTYLQFLGNGSTLSHFTLRDNATDEECAISQFDALVYQLLDGRRSIHDVLGQLQELLIPLDERSVMQAYFETLKQFVLHRAITTEDR